MHIDVDGARLFYRTSGSGEDVAGAGERVPRAWWWTGSRRRSGRPRTTHPREFVQRIEAFLAASGAEASPPAA